MKTAPSSFSFLWLSSSLTLPQANWLFPFHDTESKLEHQRHFTGGQSGRTIFQVLLRSTPSAYSSLRFTFPLILTEASFIIHLKYYFSTVSSDFLLLFLLLLPNIWQQFPNVIRYPVYKFPHPFHIFFYSEYVWIRIQSCCIWSIGLCTGFRGLLKESITNWVTIATEIYSLMVLEARSSNSRC